MEQMYHFVFGSSLPDENILARLPETSKVFGPDPREAWDDFDYKPYRHPRALCISSGMRVTNVTWWVEEITTQLNREMVDYTIAGLNKNGDNWRLWRPDVLSGLPLREVTRDDDSFMKELRNAMSSRAIISGTAFRDEPTPPEILQDRATWSEINRLAATSPEGLEQAMELTMALAESLKAAGCLRLDWPRQTQWEVANFDQ